MVVRPSTRPDFLIDRMWPLTFASSYLDGFTTVAVNLSPARPSLLDRVSFSRILSCVPAGTSSGEAGRRVVRRVWPLAVIIGSVDRTTTAINAVNVHLTSV